MTAFQCISTALYPGNGEPVTIEVWTTSVRGASCEVAYRVCDGDLTYATASTRLVAYDLATDQVRRLTDAERQMLESYRKD